MKYFRFYFGPYSLNFFIWHWFFLKKLLFYFCLGFIFILLNPEILIYISDNFKINISPFFPFKLFLCFLLFLSVFRVRRFYNFTICAMITIVLAIAFLFFYKNILLFLYFLGKVNDFNCLGKNVNSNFNCYCYDNDDNIGMTFQ